MASWIEFAQTRPDLAEKGQDLLYQGNGNASAFLATVDKNHRPRLHPVFPVMAAGELWLLIVNLSPKYRDILNNDNVALHSFPTVAGGQEFYIRARVTAVDDLKTRTTVCAATGNHQGTQDFEALFRCELRSVLYTHWENWGTEAAWPTYLKWADRTSR